MSYPIESHKNGVEGRIFLQFIVGVDGILKDFVVLKGLDTACNNEAIRVLSIAPKWKPGKQSGNAVDVRMVLPITFALGIENK